MQIIPLYNTAAPDVSHDVLAPGGYEFWSFFAHDPGTRLSASAVFFAGCPFDPAYLRAYNRYRRRPTRIAPPRPGDFSRVYFAIHRDQAILAEMTARCDSSGMEASADPSKISIGSNHFILQEDGSSHLSIRGPIQTRSWHGLAKNTPQQFSAGFILRPQIRHDPVQVRFPSPSGNGADHYWILPNSICAAEASVTLYEKGEPKLITISGRAFQDHHFGSRPFNEQFDIWLRGHIFTENGIIAFSLAHPRKRASCIQSMLIEIDSAGLREVPANVEADWTGFNKWFPHYPRRLVLNDEMRLQNPRVIESNTFGIRLIYDALIRGVEKQAWCHITH